jgi:hypothetical protein
MNNIPAPKPCTAEKRRRAAALHDAGAFANSHRTTRSVLDCSSPLELCPSEPMYANVNAN